MKREHFNTEQQKHLAATIDGSLAFIPPPLPPNLDLGDLALSLAAASNAIGELKGAARRLQNPYMLIGPLVRREALTSSAMEGTITTLGELMLEEANEDAPRSDDARETSNYIRAVQDATSKLPSLPISHRLIKEAHAILLSGLSPARGAGKRPGQYKIHQNAIGTHGDNVKSARYVPPPPAASENCMDQLEAYINRADADPARRLIDLALIHYQFEAIHPFDDGNGRIGRMIVTLAAQQNQLLDLPLLHISSFLETRKEIYTEKLFKVSTHAEWNDWIIFFLGAVEASCIGAIQIVDAILKLQTEMRLRTKNEKRHARLIMIIDSLFSKWWTSASEVQVTCQTTFPTAQSDLQALVKLDILKEVQGGKTKLYFSPDILALSDRSLQ